MKVSEAEVTNKDRGDLAWVLLAIVLGLTLLFFAWLGTSSRFMADDYCMAGSASGVSFARYAANQYRGWNGRFGYFSIAWLINQGGTMFSRFVPGLSLLMLLTGFYRLSLTLLQMAGMQNPKLIALVVAEVFLVSLMAMMPNLFQVYFWKDGMVNYFIQFIFFTFTLCWVLRLFRKDRPSLLDYGLLAILAFVSAGFSEVGSILQLLFWSLVLLAFNYQKQIASRKIISLLITALICAFLGLMIEALAPGNAVRQELLNTSHQPVTIILMALRNGLIIPLRHILKNPLWVLAQAGFGFWIGRQFDAEENKLRKWLLEEGNFRCSLLYIGLTVLFFGLATAAPTALLTESFPEDRTLLVPTFYISMFWLTGFVLIGIRSLDSQVRIERRIFQWGSTGLVLIGTFLFLTSWISQVPFYLNYAHRWDARDAQIRMAIEQGEKDLVIPGLESREGVAEVQLDPEDWVNQCMADYYGVDSITGR